MRKFLLVLCTLFFLLGFSFSAGAIQFTLDDYSITANSSDPGLVLKTAKVLGSDYDFNLNLNQSTGWIDLFDIWTDESAINNDDEVPQPIYVNFSFSAPPPSFGSDVDGSTYGYRAGLGFFQGGQVTWNDPTLLSFGPNDDGGLRVYLSDESFNDGWFWGTGSKGATVQAKFEYVAEASPVPEPATVFLLGTGLLGLAAYGRKRKLFKK